MAAGTAAHQAQQDLSLLLWGARTKVDVCLRRVVSATRGEANNGITVAAQWLGPFLITRAQNEPKVWHFFLGQALFKSICTLI